jgi:hypothetical protein
MEKCFNCHNLADHMHHVVPKSKGGLQMVPLCHNCHAKVHDVERMQTSYLVKLGLMKAHKELYCYIFYRYFLMDFTIAEIVSDLKKDDLLDYITDSKYPEKAIKNKIKSIKAIQIDDLLDIFLPILDFNNKEILNKDNLKLLYDIKLFDVDYFQK